MGQMNSSRRANQARALSKYTGPVEIFGAEQEAVMPIKHAKKLAGSVPSARFHCIPAATDWSQGTSVEIRNP